MGLTTMTEGVATEAQYGSWLEIGFDRVQGLLHSDVEPTDAVAILCRRPDQL